MECGELAQETTRAGYVHDKENTTVLMTLDELHERQKWTLFQKVDHSLGAIDQFIARLNGRVYLAFSGGKDSTILLYLCEMIKPDIKCVFVNTGCEYPDIVKFVHDMKEKGHNIDILRPQLTPRAVWQKYGFPLVSKEVAENIASIRRNPDCIKSKKALGTINPNSMFVLNKKWRYLISELYDTSNKCCTILKKAPSLSYAKEHDLAPIIGDMASESLLREKTYIRRGGCNVFGSQSSSHPLSIWMDDDIWNFIKDRNIRIADIYYKGAKRTGCVACGFGCQFKNDERLRLLYNVHPKYYEMIMNFENNGCTYRSALRKLLNKCGLVLPDEDLTLF